MIGSGFPTNCLSGVKVTAPSGARAAIDFLNNSFANLQSKEERKAPQILYAGNSISSSYLADLVDYVSDKDFSVNVISKSGTTTEPAIAFRVFKELLVKKYGQEEANKRIYATTDRAIEMRRKSLIRSAFGKYRT